MGPRPCELRYAGTVRPRQVQCPLERPAIAQVSASQNQLVSSQVGNKIQNRQSDINICRLHVEGDDGCPGHGQFCMGLHSCSDWTQADCPPCKADQNQAGEQAAEGIKYQYKSPKLTKSSWCVAAVCPLVAISMQYFAHLFTWSAGFAVGGWILPAQTALLTTRGRPKQDQVKIYVQTLQLNELRFFNFPKTFPYLFRNILYIWFQNIKPRVVLLPPSSINDENKQSYLLF